MLGYQADCVLLVLDEFEEPELDYINQFLDLAWGSMQVKIELVILHHPTEEVQPPEYTAHTNQSHCK